MTIINFCYCLILAKLKGRPIGGNSHVGEVNIPCSHVGHAHLPSPFVCCSRKADHWLPLHVRSAYLQSGCCYNVLSFTVISSMVVDFQFYLFERPKPFRNDYLVAQEFSTWTLIRRLSICHVFVVFESIIKKWDNQAVGARARRR